MVDKHGSRDPYEKELRALFDQSEARVEQARRAALGGCASQPEPRTIHRHFSHELLRDRCQHRLRELLAALESGRAQELVGELHRQAVAQFPGERAGFDASGFGIERFAIRSYLGLLITMPSPLAAKEAFMVAAVMVADDRDSVPEQVETRYFLLECHGTRDGEPQSFLHEYRYDIGGYLLVGLCWPSADAFRDAIERNWDDRDLIA